MGIRTCIRILIGNTVKLMEYVGTCILWMDHTKMPRKQESLEKAGRKVLSCPLFRS
jgi:hypothetical protein